MGFLLDPKPCDLRTVRVLKEPSVASARRGITVDVMFSVIMIQDIVSRFPNVIWNTLQCSVKRKGQTRE